MDLSVYERVFGSVAYEEIAQDDMLQFSSFIYHSIEKFELVKNLKEFRSILLSSKFTTVSLNFQQPIIYIST